MRKNTVEKSRVLFTDDAYLGEAAKHDWNAAKHEVSLGQPNPLEQIPFSARPSGCAEKVSLYRGHKPLDASFSMIGGNLYCRLSAVE